MPSVMQHVGTPNNRHNKDEKYRARLENVDKELTKYNEVIREKSVDAIYAEHLQPGFEAFNARQKRKDRRLDVKWGCSTYLEYQRKLDETARASKNEIDKKGRPPIRELIWQIGNPEQGYGSAGQTDESRQRIKDMLLECQAEAERRYPNLAWGDVVFHADEVSIDADDEVHGSLHLHSSFVPLCFQNKQGADVQVAFERCLHEMGFATFQEWKHDLDDIMETVLQRHGMERIVMNNNEKHQESTEFHRQQAIRRQTKELEARLDATAKEVASAERHVELYARMEENAEATAKRAHDRAVEENRRADAARRAREQEEQILQTTIQSKEEYTREVNSIKTFFSSFFERIREVVLPIANARDDQEVTVAFKKFEAFWNHAQEQFGKIGLRIRNLLGFEHKSNMPMEEREAGTLLDTLNDAYQRSEEANSEGATSKKQDYLK